MVTTLNPNVTEERVREMLAAAEKATPGPWEVDEAENRDDRGRFTSYGVAARPSWSPDHPKSVVDTLNSGVMSINTEHDEDGSSSWDEQGAADTAFISLCDPQTISSILTELLAARRTIEGAARDVIAERQRQVETEGWTPEHDDEHAKGEMARAAACYVLVAAATLAPLKTAARHVVEWLWPWDARWWKPTDRRRDLVKAGALIIAEIERLDRAALSNSGEQVK